MTAAAAAAAHAAPHFREYLGVLGPPFALFSGSIVVIRWDKPKTSIDEGWMESSEKGI